jgi:hypothetical protein
MMAGKKCLKINKLKKFIPINRPLCKTQRNCIIFDNNGSIISKTVGTELATEKYLKTDYTVLRAQILKPAKKYAFLASKTREKTCFNRNY